MSDQSNSLLAILGPTASGKTAHAIRLAKSIGGEIISVDSRQVYRQMAIGTAKPTLEEQQSVRHHLIDTADVDEKFSAADFQTLADRAIQDILQRGKVDLLVGGSPCQGFSFAGKQLNFDDPRSKLFFEFVRILKECKPKYFLLENVVMAKASQQVISQYLGVEPIEINSSLVSAQHRKRLYWTNIPFEMPDDKKIYLKDILENGLASDKMTKDGKAYCLTARYQGAVWWNSIQRKQRTMVKVDKPISKYGLKQVGVANLNGHDLLKRVYSSEGKSPTLNAHGGGNTEPKVAFEQFKINPEIVSNYVPDLKGAVCDPYNKRIIKGDKSTALRTNSSNGNTWVNDEKHSWRKLTPLECERLQTVPDNYTQGVSNTQRYKMIGNGWTVDVIAHIFKNITKE